MRQLSKIAYSNTWWHYVLTALLTIVAVAVTITIWPIPKTEHADPPPMVIVGLAPLFTAWFFGQGPGLLATLLTALAYAWICYPADSIVIARHSDLIRLGVYIGTMVSFSLMSGARRRAENSLLFLSQASAALAGSLDYPTVLERSAALAVPTLTEFCAIYIVDENGKLERVVAIHADGAKTELARQFCFQLPDLERDTALAAVLRMGSSDVQNHVTAAFLQASSASPEEFHLKQDLGIKARLIVPLMARGNILGAMALQRSTSKAIGPRDIDMAEELARRIAIALDNARLYREAQHRAEFRFAPAGLRL